MQQVCIEGVRAPTQILGRSWFYPNLTTQKNPDKLGWVIDVIEINEKEVMSLP